MSDIVIRVENLGKKYRIRHPQPQRYLALRDVLAQKLVAPWRRLGSLVRHRPRPTAPGPLILNPKSEIRNPKSFLALKDVSFEVWQGEVGGIMGRNGVEKIDAAKNPEPNHGADGEAGVYQRSKSALAPKPLVI